MQDKFRSLKIKLLAIGTTVSACCVPSLYAADTPVDTLQRINLALPLLHDLKAQALKHSDKLAALERELLRRSKLKSRAGTKVRDFADSLLPYDAFGSSEEGAQVALDNDLEPSDRHSYTLAKRRLVDQLELTSTSLFLDIASALASNDNPELLRLWKELNALVEPDYAAGLITRLQRLAKVKGLPPDTTVNLSQSWQQAEGATKIAIQQDPVLQELTEKLEKLSSHSRKKKALFGSLESCLEVAAWLSPGFLIPAAADVTNATVVQLGGGSEESKLLTEAYAMKQKESRKATLTKQVYKAALAHQLGLTLKSSLLVMCADAAILDAENESKTVQTAEATGANVPRL